MNVERGYRGAMPAVPLEPLRDRDPRDVGDFRLLGRLGGGGMGVAFLAEGRGQWAVVKIIRSELTDSPDFQARLRRELEAMSRTAGPRTAEVLAEGVEEDPSWFAMEFIPGVTLARRVADSGPIERSRIDVFARELAEVLSDVHQAGVIHRDLKPSNIMMSPSGPRLIDFGIAAFEGGTQLTATGSVIGTSGWLAPEQVKGDPVSFATDVHAWALCVLYGATGRQPIEADGSGAAMYRVLESTPEIPAFISSPLRDLLEGALAKDPARRPSVERILHEMGSRYVVNAQTEQAQSPTLPLPEAEQLTQQTSAAQPLRAAGAPSAPSQPSVSRKRPVLIALAIAVVVLVAGIAGLVALNEGDEVATASEQIIDEAAVEFVEEVREAETSQPIETVEPEPAAVVQEVAPPTSEPSPAAIPAPTYATTVDYANDRIPDRVFDNTLDWSFDICVSDLEFLKAANRQKVSFRQGAGGRQLDVEVAGVQGGRCRASEVNLTFDYSEPTPPNEAVGTGWSACRPYRVVLPETANFARSTIDFCVRTRAEPAS